MEKRGEGVVVGGQTIEETVGSGCRSLTSKTRTDVRVSCGRDTVRGGGSACGCVRACECMIEKERERKREMERERERD